MRGRRTEEVPAVVTVATGTLGPVIAKLADLLGSDYKLRRHTRKDLNFIKSKFKSMHTLFWNIWETEDFDAAAASKDLKKEALDLADDMDDAIDDFILTMDRSRRNRRLIQTKTKTARPFEDFKKRVNDVWGQCRIKWKNKTTKPFCSLFSKKYTVSSPSKPTHRPPFVRKNASAVVGMDAARDKLISYLVGEESTIVLPQLRMAAIVGSAGMGKTTLANLVYEAIADQFQCRAFVSVTPSPNMKEVLTSILQQVAADYTGTFAGTQGATSEEHLIDKIFNFLKNRRYLVVIDDVWHSREWETITKCLPENNLASRIVTTTRINSVAQKWTDDFEALVYHINARWYSRGGEWFYAVGFEDIYGQLWKELRPGMVVGEGFDSDHGAVHICACMPLALVCLSSAVALVLEEQEKQGLSRLTSDVPDMIEKQITQNGIQKTPGFEPLVESLQLSYNDLPHHMLKTCLLYCSIYPWSFEIQRDNLVRQWIAEFFVDTEETGNNYFDELVSRGFIQPVNNFDDNELVGYIMHPMMRDFLRWKLCEDTFISCSSNIPSPFARRTHRLCIDDFPYDDDAVDGMDPLFGLDWSRVRSLVVFDRAERVPLEKLERLRVLDLQENLDLSDHHLKDICGLLRLRHLLGLRGSGLREIPPEIARLQRLETLEIRESGITHLPREMGDLQQLKTLCMRKTMITELPREIVMRLKKLKTLDVSENKETTELPKEIGNLQQLKTLNVSKTNIAELPTEIGELRHLTTLNASETNIAELPKEIGRLQHLENLNLNYTGIAKLPSEIGSLENLETLYLDSTKVTKIPREIGGLKKLKILETDINIGSLPWEAGQLSKLVGLPDCVRQAWKNSDVVAELAGEILHFQQIFIGDGGLVLGTSHMHIPQWIKEHFNNIGLLDIRICKLEEDDLRILREMPNLDNLSLRFEVVPRKPIVISSDGFARLENLTVDSGVPRITFQEGAMPKLRFLTFEFKLYGGPPNRDPIGITHLMSLWKVFFECNEWYRAQDRPCISAMIEVIRKEAREHHKNINLFVTGREYEGFPAHDGAWGFPTSEIDEWSSIGSAEMDEEILHKFGYHVEH